MACINKGNKCDNVTRHLKEFILNDEMMYADVKVNGVSVTNINDSFASPLTDEEICAYLLTIELLPKHSNWDWTSKAEDNLKKARKAAEKALCKNLKALTCKDIRETDPDKEAEYQECRTKSDTHVWSDTDCMCKKRGKGTVVDEPEKVYGCLDPTATDYWCKIKGNDCVDNKPPENVIDSPCSYSKELAVTNKYLFCNDGNGCTPDNTTTEGWITPTTDMATMKDNIGVGVKYIGEVQNAVRNVVENINPDAGVLFLNNKKGFYTSPFPPELVNEFTNALTVAIFNTKFKAKESNNTFPFTMVTVYSTDSQPLGQFIITPETDKNGTVDSIRQIKQVTSSRTLNIRLRNEIGTALLNPNHANAFINAFGPSGNFNDVNFTIKNGKIIKESVNEGLGRVLEKEPVGLAKLLK